MLWQAGVALIDAYLTTPLDCLEWLVERNVPSLHEQKLQFESLVIYDHTGTSAGRLRPGEDSCIRGKGGVDCVDIIDVKGLTKRCL